MMTDRTHGAQGAATVPWRNLPRTSKQRTSAPTDGALAIIGAQIRGRRGVRTTADAIVLAALNLAVPGGLDSGWPLPDALYAEVERIENQRWELPDPAAEPGS